MQSYEIDFMEWFVYNVTAFHATPAGAAVWMDGLARAAEELKVPVQICTATGFDARLPKAPLPPLSHTLTHTTTTTTRTHAHTREQVQTIHIMNTPPPRGPTIQFLSFYVDVHVLFPD